MSKAKFKRKTERFDLRYKDYIRKSVYQNTISNIKEAKKKDESYDKDLTKHMTTFESSNQTIIGSHLFRMLFEARKDPEFYAKNRLNTLKTLFNFVSENNNWYDLWLTFMQINKSLYEQSTIESHQLHTELIDMFRMYIPYPNFIHGISNNTYTPIFKRPTFYVTKPLISYYENKNAFGRKKTKQVEPQQYLTAEIFSYLSKSYGLYNSDNMDLFAENSIVYDDIPTLILPRSIGTLDDLVSVINQYRKFTINPNGVVIDCYNTGEVDQVILYEQNNYLIWKVHFNKIGWILDNRGLLINDLSGSEYSGYFSPEYIPSSIYSVHSDFVDFEFRLYEFILECYADIVCGIDIVNKRFNREALNMGTLEIKDDDDNIKFEESVGFRYIPRKIYNSAKHKSIEDNQDMQIEIKKYFVSGHLRKLPNNQIPSKEAVEHANEYGIDIPKGYTFVRPYESGEEKIRTHYIKRL